MLRILQGRYVVKCRLEFNHAVHEDDAEYMYTCTLRTNKGTISVVREAEDSVWELYDSVAK